MLQFMGSPRRWPLQLETRRERSQGGVNLGCTGRDSARCGWVVGPCCVPGGRQCGWEPAGSPAVPGYEDLQDFLELIHKKDVLFIIEDWNAKVGSQETPGGTGKFGLGIQNEAGQRLIEFCQENAS